MRVKNSVGLHAPWAKGKGSRAPGIGDELEEDVKPARPTAGRDPSARRPEVSHELLDACRRGDREAFGTLFDLCRDRVYAIALHYTGEPAAAADVTQDVFIRLFSRLTQFRGQCAFMTWLYRIVANAALDDRRSRARLTSLDEAVATPSVKAMQVDDVERRQSASHVRAALATLRPKLRIALVLRYVEDLSYEEIGEVLGTSTGTVASRLSRAHVAFGQAFERIRKGDR
jgi:RNA polymerase sigma-70 factor (ECF subfamily)